MANITCGQLMQIRRGSTRVVLVFQTLGLVFKFPTLKQYTIHGPVFHYLRGLIANLTEFATYILCKKSSFLTPVFSLGFVNIQKYQGENKLDEETLNEVEKFLSLDAGRVFLTIGSHHWDTPNFRKTEDGIKMIDFGDNFDGRTVPISHFIIPFYKEIDEAFKKITATNK